MNSQSLERIEQSFEAITPNIGHLTENFYDRLFDGRPEIRSLFKGNMDIQRQHLAAALAIIARNLRMLDTVTEALRELGAGHARVGVRPEYYPPVRDSMLHALETAVGPNWSPELAADWRALLDLICRTMLEGASHAASVDAKP